MRRGQNLVGSGGFSSKAVLRRYSDNSLKTVARRINDVHAEPVCAVIESMTGARLVHDTLEACGWDVEIADAQKVKGLLPWPARPTRSTRWCSRS